MDDHSTDDETYDVIVVGAGVAGCVAAYRLASAGHSVVLLERGTEPGSKNLSGGVFYCRVMEQVFPQFAERAPVERRITRNRVSFLNPTSAVTVDYWDQRLADPVNAVSVLRARLDPWLAQQCEDAGVMVAPGVKVDELLIEDGRVVGVRADGDELRARVVVAADGVNSFLARQAGVRAPEPPQRLAVGVKSVVRMPRRALESRFGVTGDEGVAYAVVGDCTQGVAGGGFLYTNLESVSVGVVLRLDSLAESGLASADVHDHFLAHPGIAAHLADGELAEYGCHLTIEDGPAMIRQDLARPGLLLIGDAAGCTLNTGLTIRGMDLAAGSAIAAADAVHAALGSGDVGALGEAYRAALGRSFVGQDMATYARAPGFLEHDELYGQVGLLMADVLHGVFDLDTTPRRRLVPTARSALKRSPLTLRRLAALGLGGVRAL